MIVRVGMIFPAGVEDIRDFEGTHMVIENNGMLYVLKKKTVVAVIHANRWMWARIVNK